jgi:hypothetical protein
MCRPFLSSFRADHAGGSGRAWPAHARCWQYYSQLVLLFTSLFAIPLACQCCFHATLLTGFQVVGVTLHFLDDVFLLNLAFKPAQSVFERFAFLQTNLCQRVPPPNPPEKDTIIISEVPLEIQLRFNPWDSACLIAWPESCGRNIFTSGVKKIPMLFVWRGVLARSRKLIS